MYTIQILIRYRDPVFIINLSESKALGIEKYVLGLPDGKLLPNDILNLSRGNLVFKRDIVDVQIFNEG